MFTHQMQLCRLVTQDLFCKLNFPALDVGIAHNFVFSKKTLKEPILCIYNTLRLEFTNKKVNLTKDSVHCSGEKELAYLM